MKLIDISHVIDENTPIYPGDYKASLSKHKSVERDHYTSYLLQSCMHTGTHVDLPMHLLNDKRTANEFSIDHFIGKGVLLDVRKENPITMKPQYNESVSEGSIVLLYTGFDANYFDEEYFTEHPVIEDQFIDFLVSKKIKILGMDMPAPDYPPFALHKALLSNDIFVLENLTNLHSLIGVNHFEVIAFPLKISAEASFVRAVCRTG